jgi:PadR family transcriptional regulator, regulatory protein PadR
LVLDALQGSELNGYDIGARISEHSDRYFELEEGSLYPCLYRLEKRGWIISRTGLSENNRRARYYRLTATGREQLKREHEWWEASSEAVSKVLGRRK